MSFFGLSVFKLPTVAIPVDPVIFVQHVPMNRYVGCVIITDSITGYGYDIIIPKLSGQNSYGVFSGKVGGSYSDYDCTHTLMRSIHLPFDNSTRFIEFNDPATGNPHKIYVKYMRRVDLSRLNASLRSSIASNDFAYFTRFPLSTVSVHHNFQTLDDDAGVTRFLNSVASACVSRIVRNLGRFV